MSARSLSAHLVAESGVGRLSAQAGRLLKLQRILDHAVPAALARHTRIANLKPGKLVIHAQNAAVAAKIRQILPRLTQLFQNEVVDLIEILVKVQPLDHEPAQTKTKIRSGIGHKQKQALTSLAEKLPENSPLKQSLSRFVTSTSDRESEKE